MQRNANAARPFLLLLAAAFLVTAPVLLSGILEEQAGLRDQKAARHETAGNHFRLAAIRLPWRGDLWEQAGRETLLAQNPEQAVPMLQRAPALSAAGWVALARAYRQTGDWNGARNAYESALRYGAYTEAYAGLAEIHRHDGDMEAEGAALQSLLRFQPGNAAAQYRLGLLLSVTDIDLALVHLELASQLDEQYKPAFNTLRSALVLANLKTSASERSVTIGRALGLVGEWDLAVLTFRQAVELDENDAQAWAWLGEARQHVGGDGLVELDRALALDNQSVIVRGLRGLYWKRNGNDSRSLQEYEAAAAADPQNPAWAAALGESHARLGDLVTALADYQRAVRLAPDDPTYLRLLASFCAEYNIQIESVGLPAAQKAVDLSAQDPLNLATLGWLQLGAEQPFAAQKTLLAVLEVMPEDALAHYHLALAYLQTGDRAAARAHLEAAVRLDPQGDAGAQAAQVLKQQFP